MPVADAHLWLDTEGCLAQCGSCVTGGANVHSDGHFFGRDPATWCSLLGEGACLLPRAEPNCDRIAHGVWWMAVDKLPTVGIFVVDPSDFIRESCRAPDRRWHSQPGSRDPPAQYPLSPRPSSCGGVGKLRFFMDS